MTPSICVQFESINIKGIYMCIINNNYLTRYFTRCWISEETGLLWSFIVTLLIFLMVCSYLHLFYVCTKNANFTVYVVFSVIIFIPILGYVEIL